MPISKQELEDMNDLLSKGKTIAELAKKYPKYEYSEIYWQVNDYSFLGKKRSISNRLKKLATSKSSEERARLADEAQKLLNELYKQLKHNSSKLVAINALLREK